METMPAFTRHASADEQRAMLEPLLPAASVVARDSGTARSTRGMTIRFKKLSEQAGLPEIDLQTLKRTARLRTPSLI